jgi:hypothetical protein
MKHGQLGASGSLATVPPGWQRHEKGPAEQGPSVLDELRTLMFVVCKPFGPCWVSNNEARSP